VDEVLSYPTAADVPASSRSAMPHWGWEGLLP
jgi:hypothetical protein